MKKNRRNVSAFMERDCCRATIRMTKLFVLATLTDFDKTNLLQDSNYFCWLEDGNITHLKLPLPFASQRNQLLASAHHLQATFQLLPEG